MQPNRIRKVDVNDKRFWCPECDLKTGAQFRLAKHQKQKGPLYAKFSCPRCKSWWNSAHAYCGSFQVMLFLPFLCCVVWCLCRIGFTKLILFFYCLLYGRISNVNAASPMHIPTMLSTRRWGKRKTTSRSHTWPNCVSVASRGCHALLSQ